MGGGEFAHRAEFHLNRSNGCGGAVVSPILTKFGTMKQIGPLQPIDRYNFLFLKLQHGGGVMS